MTDRPMIYRDDAIEAMQALAPKHSQYTPAYIVEAQAALTALAPVQVGVKPLEWRRQSVDCEVAETVLGNAAVQNESHALKPNRWGWWMVGSGEDDSPTGYEDDLEAAKAAAQADYEARIRSAIAPVQVDATHIRAEAEMETCGNCMGSGYGGHPDSGQFCHECLGLGAVFPSAALIATPAPSPDVGALAEAADWAFRHVSFMPMDEATASEFVHHRAAIAKMKDGAARALAAQEGGE